MDNQVNLNEITDENELYKMYVETSETLLKLEQAINEQRQNHQSIRVRLSQLQEEAAKPKKEKAE